ncbi:hypothetical protein [Streptomyces sp. NPDC058623]|uniref:hypothetical protein n=1 Tax=Streptomyces sp. NPDC058623 TaxID=3346563 RepID=UPI0036467EC3
MSSASRVSDSLTVHPPSGRAPSRGREGSISRGSVTDRELAAGVLVDDFAELGRDLCVS